MSKKRILLLDYGSGHHFDELQVEGKIYFRSEKIGQFRRLVDYVYKPDHFTILVKILYQHFHSFRIKLKVIHLGNLMGLSLYPSF